MVSTRYLSTGDPSTLGAYRRLSVIAFGPESRPVKYLDRKIAESPNGEDEPVIVDETQMLQVLGALYLQECDERDGVSGNAGLPEAGE